MSTITIGVNLAKSVFSVCEVEVPNAYWGGKIYAAKRSAFGWRRCRQAPWWRWMHAVDLITGEALSVARLATTADGCQTGKAVL
jgi:hypothetical protein